MNEVDEATGTSVGLFHYFGILKCFGKILDKVWSIVPDRHAFKLQLNVDGLPLCKSTSTQFWPILGMLQGCSKKPLLIGLFCGTSNPNSLTEYLHDLVQELQILMKQKTSNTHRFRLEQLPGKAATTNRQNR